MSEDMPKPSASGLFDANGSSAKQGVRYSLKEMIEEVAIERKESVFGRELVDSTEIEKMFGKHRKKKKRKA